jgi:dTDP-4-amino-4,6-dideoxygalactose transaminase
MPPRRALGEAEERMIADVLQHYRGGVYDPGYQGVFEERYCAAFVEKMGGGYADAVATGTVALYIALAALDLPEGSEVMVSPITDPGTISAIILNRLKPRLIDSAPGSYNIGADQFASRIGPNVRAAIIVHSIGQAAPIDAIVDEAKQHGIRIVEDCSQSHGALWNGRPVGSFGDIAAFSTMYRKAHITGASGGVVYSRDLDLYHACLAHADRGKPRWVKGFDDRDPAQFLFPALNLHTDEISCAIGCSSLMRLDETLKRRRAWVRNFNDRLARSSLICTPYPCSENDSPFVVPVLVDRSRITCDVESFAKAIMAEGIGLNPHYRYLVWDWPWVRRYLADDFNTPAAHLVRDSSFVLYVNENYGDEEIEDVIAAIEKVERHFSKSAERVAR